MADPSRVCSHPGCVKFYLFQVGLLDQTVRFRCLREHLPDSRDDARTAETPQERSEAYNEQYDRWLRGVRDG